ncbi:nitrite reductase, cytochrome c55X [Candidatus Thiomargarita nelsonii]|uniref:Nitrite reductase, cytochrome c55X n=1 Tax=Candidatus Thiomargarita nelsonii TaxID=1003181 RepID=A0A0A6RJ22_9GAMM|nr:nitrite reductase, cytochrome c55X [Candidatus Thiomargarita nelsonii]
MKRLFALLFFLPALTVGADEIPPERQSDLLHLLRHDCGACHGMTLKGGLGPPLLPQSLAIYPREFLLQTILLGRAGTPMPPWRDFLTQAEAEWLLEQLLKGIDDNAS